MSGARTAGWAGLTIHCETEGAGPPLVLSHGFGDSAEIWREQTPLAEHYTLTRWDLLGHGQSDKPTDEAVYHRDRAMEELHAIVERQPDTPVLMGHSVGGYLSQRYALLHPDRVRALVLLNTGPGYRNPEGRARWNELVRTGVGRYDVPAAAWRLLEQHDSFVIDNITDLTPPTFVVVGDKDRGYVKSMEFYQRKLPNAESLIVEGAGHAPHVTHGRSVTAAIAAFLERRLG